MGIKRYIANADNVITNAYRMNLTTRATGANMGLADSLEVFNIYGQESSASSERARILIKFPVDQISADRTSGLIAASSSVGFYLNMYNVKHAETLPTNFSLQVYALSQSWSEGRGVDMDEYEDLGESNWLSASATTAWSNDGATHITGASYHEGPIFEASFTEGTEDLSIDVSDIVEQWILGGAVAAGKYNHGFLIKMSGTTVPSSPTSDGDTTTYYTKKFSARGSEFFFKRPVIEARWDSRTTDDRGNFYYSSSLAPSADNLNTLYLYNIVRGRLRDIPVVTTGDILVSLYSGSSDNSAPDTNRLLLYDGNTEITGGHVSTGIYSCSVGITASASPLTHIFDVWHTGGVEYFTGSFLPIVEAAEEINPSNRYVLNITNLRWPDLGYLHVRKIGHQQSIQGQQQISLTL